MSQQVNIKINDQQLSVSVDSTVLQAARQLGFSIPTMCHMEGLKSHTSCMLCMVKDKKTNKLFASCSMPVTSDMDIITEDGEIIEARRTALELLLSDHTGDCEAPCQLSCPAHMNIPEMNRLLQKGDWDAAVAVVEQDIPFPSVLGRICPAPCEKACKRASIDEPVSICLLKRFAGDHGSPHSSPKPQASSPKPQASSPKPQHIAIVGAGPAGLTAAYYLALEGYKAIVFEKEAVAGGALRREELAERLSAEVLDQEIAQVMDTGFEIRFGQAIDQSKIAALQQEFAVVLLATGHDTPIEHENHEALFSVPRASKMAVRAVGYGKDLAHKAMQYLNGETPVGTARKFNSRFGKLQEAEFAEYLKESNDDIRLQPAIPNGGFTNEETIQEAARCLHCDCRKVDHCSLRDLSHEYQANQRRFWNESRQLVTKQVQEGTVIYEASKCIKCGICVRITRQHQEQYGFSFIGRGFDVKIATPFGESLQAALTKTAGLVADACPTGAISKMK